MFFSDTFLKSLTQFEVTGDFLPFTSRDILKVEDYVAQLLANLKKNPHLLVSDQDIYSSFIQVKISKSDKSDTKVTQQGTGIIEHTTSLSLYFCTLAPYWFYGACNWSTNWISCIGGSCTGGSSCFLEPEDFARVDHGLWNAEIEAIQTITQNFNYTLLSVESLIQPAPAYLDIQTILADKPYRVFDCFFYWMD